MCRAQAFGSFGYGFPDLLGEASNVVSMGGGCGWFSDGVLFRWIVLPPAVPPDSAAVVSLAEVRYIGVSVTVASSAHIASQGGRAQLVEIVGTRGI